MNAIRVKFTVSDLSDLFEYLTDTYIFNIGFFNNATGLPLGNPNIPDNFPAIVYSLVPSFTVDVPVTDETYTIPNVRVQVFANEDDECCVNTKVVTIVNTKNCSLRLDSVTSTCGPVATLTMSNGGNPLPEPLIISIKAQGSSVESFLSRSGNLVSFIKVNASIATYRITITGADGCSDFKDFELVCFKPNFAFEYLSPAICDGEGNVQNGTARIYATSYATRYAIAYNTAIYNRPCSETDGIINSSGDTILTLVAPAQGTTIDAVLRIYNGPGCDLFVDYSLTINSPICGLSCPPDGTWIENGEGEYYKLYTTSPTANPSGYDIVQKRSVYYAMDGTYLYNTDMSINSLLTLIPMWKSNSSTNGPMNRCSVWTNREDISFPVNYLPLGMWIGFSKCLTGLTIGKTYYVGLEADNHFRLLVDSEIIFENTTNSTHFRNWKIIPVVAKRVDMLISMEARNSESVAGFGCEVYDNTAAEIIAATTVGDLNIIFSSISKVAQKFDIGGLSGGVQYGYGCPDGYTYNPCSGLCQKIEYCEP